MGDVLSNFADITNVTRLLMRRIYYPKLDDTDVGNKTGEGAAKTNR